MRTIQNQAVDRHVIWSDIDLDIDDWRDGLKEEYPGLTEDEMYALMCEINSEYLDDERANLNIQLSQPIIAIGDLGLWYGRRSGYKMIESGNIRDCLYSNRDIDYAEWYLDEHGDLCSEQIHHDGTNHILYRVFKEGTTDWQRENLKEKIYAGRATRADISRLTKRLGDEIAQVYGWSIPKMRIGKEQER